MMLRELLSLNRDKVLGIIIGLELLLIITGILGLVFSVSYERVIGEYPVTEHYDVKLGESENINGEEVSAYIVNTGSFTTSCLNNVSISSSLSSVGEIEGGTFCRGKKIYLEDWILEVKDVHTKTSQAILIKTELRPIPLFYVLISIITLLVLLFIVAKLTEPEKLSEERVREIIRDEVQIVDEEEPLKPEIRKKK